MENESPVSCGSESRCAARVAKLCWRAWRVKCWTVLAAGKHALEHHAMKSKAFDARLHEARRAAGKARRKAAEEWFEKNHGKKR